MMRPVTLLALALSLNAHALSASGSNKQSSQPILVVGASGGTGFRALKGLLDVGYTPEQIRVLTRNTNKPSMVALHQLGFQTYQADLEEPSTLSKATSGCVGCYVHSTSSDTKKLDTAEVDRARNLAAAMAAQGDVKIVVYNSAAAEEGHGIYRIEQKHAVEQVFQESNIASFVSLRANLFMEELWKGYTRPAILKGKFPFSIPSDRNIHLTSVRDMGRLAGTILQSPDTFHDKVLKINVAGDVLTPREMANAFAKAQNSPCVHDQSRFFALVARLFLKDLHQISRFYRTSTETTDTKALQEQFPGLLTSFETFLEETNWADTGLTYENLALTIS